MKKNYDDNDLAVLREFGYKRPSDFNKISNQDLENDLEGVNTHIKSLTGEINGRRKKQNPSQDYINETYIKEAKKETLKKYKITMKDYFISEKYKVGKGLYFSPQELLKRFELLSGSLAAGNNGVLPEYIQIAHRLRDLGIITNNQPNKLLKSIYS